MYNFNDIVAFKAQTGTPTFSDINDAWNKGQT